MEYYSNIGLNRLRNQYTMKEELSARLRKKLEILTLLGDASRMKIIKKLAQKETSVSDLAQAVGMQIACTSHHLQLLKKNKIIASRRDGNTIYYRLEDNPFITNILTLLLQ